MRDHQLTQQYWHVVPDDEIGGWAITNYNTDATSRLDPGLGQFALAGCMTEDTARHIVDSHNRELKESETNILDMFSNRVAIQIKREGEIFWFFTRVNFEETNEGLAVAVQNLADEACRKLRDQ